MPARKAPGTASDPPPWLSAIRSSAGKPQGAGALRRSWSAGATSVRVEDLRLQFGRERKLNSFALRIILAGNEMQRLHRPGFSARSTIHDFPRTETKSPASGSATVRTLGYAFRHKSSPTNSNSPRPIGDRTNFALSQTYSRLQRSFRGSQLNYRRNATAESGSG